MKKTCHVLIIVIRICSNWLIKPKIMAITFMYCNRLHAWWSTQSRLATLLSFLHAGGSDFRLYDGYNLKTYLLMSWYGPDALVVCQAHRVLPAGFLLLWYSVLFTVESLSLLYLLVIS